MPREENEKRRRTRRMKEGDISKHKTRKGLARLEMEWNGMEMHGIV
jgi:hypothetical protein